MKNIRELTDKELDRILEKKERNIINGGSEPEMLEYTTEKYLRGLSDSELSLKFFNGEITEEEFIGEINKPQRSKKRLKKMCEGYGITTKKAEQIQEKTNGLVEHFGIDDKDSWQIALIFAKTEGERNYIQAVLNEFEDD